jgi:hypothetical protein
MDKYNELKPRVSMLKPLNIRYRCVNLLLGPNCVAHTSKIKRHLTKLFHFQKFSITLNCVFKTHASFFRGSAPSLVLENVVEQKQTILDHKDQLKKVGVS